MYVNQVDTECGQGKGDSIHYSGGFIIQQVITDIKSANIGTMEILLQQ